MARGREQEPEGLERRTVRLVELRVQGEGDEEPRIAGYAAVFSQLSEDLGGWREIIQPGFFDQVLEDDVRALWNHNADMVLGRTRSGTLALRQDDQGLRIEIQPPATQWARDALVTMDRGDVDQASFAFRVRPDGDRWDMRDDGTVIRTLLAGGCARLYDVSPVTYPAYPQTSMSVRSLVENMRAGQGNAGGDGQGAPPPGGGPGEPRHEIDGAQERLSRESRLLDLAELDAWC